MTLSALVQYAAFLLVVTILVKPVGRYMARVFHREKTFLDPEVLFAYASAKCQQRPELRRS